MITSLGSFALGAINLVASSALSFATQLVASKTAKIAELQVKLAGLTVDPSKLLTPPQFATGLAAAAAAYNPLTAVAQLLAMIPTVQAEIAVELPALAASQSAAAALSASLSTGGLRLYACNGSTGSLGNEISGQVQTDYPTPRTVKALLIVAESEAAWTALSATMKTS